MGLWVQGFRGLGIYSYMGSGVLRVLEVYGFRGFGGLRPSGFILSSHLHGHDEARQVLSSLSRVTDGGEVVEVGGSSVPVHHNDVHVLLLGQQVDDVVDPDGWRPGGPVPVDHKGGGTVEVEERLGGQMVVVDLAAAVDVVTGVEQQPDVQAGSHEAVGQVQVCEVITGLFGPALLLTWFHNTEEA